jgi:acetyl-CoA acetyltransferase family protein
VKHRIAVIDGIRTPMGKFSGMLRTVQADNLGAHVVRELLYRTDIPKSEIDEVIIGNVGQPAQAQNIARIISLKAGLSKYIPAYTVHRNCASGLQAITSAANQVSQHESNIIIAGGVESMSNIPFLFPTPFSDFLTKLKTSKSLLQKIRTMTTFEMAYLKPIIGLHVGLTDPFCGLNMGQTAEVLVKEFGITREQQDRFACQSHNRAQKAQELGIFQEEIAPYILSNNSISNKDEGIRFNQTTEALAKLNPYFDKLTGTVTAGNSSQITDGAAAILLMNESRAKALGLKPLGYLTHYAYAGLEGKRMGLGPAYATAKVLKKSRLKLKDFDLIEMNEAFAGQVLANIIAFDSKKFAEQELGLSKPLGKIDPKKLNVNGGAIALGHPVGMTGTRLILTLLKELKRRKKHLGLATLCIGGGQGAAAIVEVK